MSWYGVTIYTRSCLWGKHLGCIEANDYEAAERLAAAKFVDWLRAADFIRLEIYRK